MKLVSIFQNFYKLWPARAKKSYNGEGQKYTISHMSGAKLEGNIKNPKYAKVAVTSCKWHFRSIMLFAFLVFCEINETCETELGEMYFYYNDTIVQV